MIGILLFNSPAILLYVNQTDLEIETWSDTGEGAVEVAWFYRDGDKRSEPYIPEISKKRNDVYVRIPCLELADCKSQIGTISRILSNGKPRNTECGKPYIKVNFLPRLINKSSGPEYFSIDRTGTCVNSKNGNFEIEISLFKILEGPIDRW